ncbi:hypothetical protein ANTQUA_LOCUS7296 [Anthophora quadrimaculata]
MPTLLIGRERPFYVEREIYGNIKRFICPVNVRYILLPCHTTAGWLQYDHRGAAYETIPGIVNSGFPTSNL